LGVGLLAAVVALVISWSHTSATKNAPRVLAETTGTTGPSAVLAGSLPVAPQPVPQQAAAPQSAVRVTPAAAPATDSSVSSVLTGSKPLVGPVKGRGPPNPAAPPVASAVKRPRKLDPSSGDIINPWAD
jgi:hypothetical protein